MGEIKIHNSDNGNIVIELSSKSAKTEVIEKGPWSFSRRPLVIRKWEPGMPMDREEVETIPI